MRRRKERICQGLEVDFDLLDSDMLRCYMGLAPRWQEVPGAVLTWQEYSDQPDWSHETRPEPRYRGRPMYSEDDWAVARRMVRLWRYKSYACLADLAKRPREPGEFVIRRPPELGEITFVCEVSSSRLPAHFGDPDLPSYAEQDFGFLVTDNLAEAQRFTHDQAIRLTIRIMQVTGFDVAGDNGNYYEPMRANIAAALAERAARRPRPSEDFQAMIEDLSREP
jgi:hypothetical protein